MPATKIIIPPRRVLWKHQQAGVLFALPVVHPALWWKMRLGKTLTCIRRCLLYKNCKTFLVVAPFAALSAWESELQAEGQQMMLLYGERKKRLALLQNTISDNRIWFLINKEGHFAVPEIAGIFWDVVILDESVFVAEPPNLCQTTKFFLTHFRTVKHRWCLCGTPAPESPLQYFCQLKWLDAKAIPEKNFYEFRHKHFEMIGYDWKITDDGSKYLSYYLNKCSHFLNRGDVHLGGIKIREQRVVELPSELRRAYNKIEKDFYFEIEGVPHDTIFATQKYIWMKRLCGGFNSGIGLESYHKCNELLSMMTGELKNEPVVIWCQFIEEVFGVCNFLLRAGITTDYIYGDVPPVKREEKRKMFQAGNLQALVIMTSTMCFSSKLTAASALIYYSSPESGKIREQSEDRHIDVTKSDSVLLIDMPCLNTVEEDILESHIQKETHGLKIERMVKSIQRRVL
jgi:hypothetical protein